MSWVRLDASAFHDRALRRRGPDAMMAWIAALMLSKERTWKVGDEHGFLPASEFDGLEVAMHWQLPRERAPDFDRAIADLATGDCPLFLTDENGWWIANWKKYQMDPTAADRQADLRTRRRESLRNGDNRDKPAKPRKKTPRTAPVTVTLVSHGSHANATGRDVTKSTSPSTGQREVVAATDRATVGRPSGAAAAPSVVGAAEGILSPAENHARLEALVAKIAPEPKPPDQSRFEAKRAAALAALGGVPPCDAPDIPNKPKEPQPSSRTRSEQEPLNGSERSTPTEPLGVSHP